jgi:hypothetical protein
MSANLGQGVTATRGLGASMLDDVTRRVSAVLLPGASLTGFEVGFRTA